MATRMQQRRGTASQWTTANPTLAAGEIGFETDTGKFKIGNGSSAWSALSYFTDNTALATLLADAPEALNTLNELAAAINDDPTFFTTVSTNLSNHQSDTTNIHGIVDTANLATTQDITNHNSDTTNVHGIANTSVLATNASVAGDISSHNALTTNVHGISDTSVLATQTDITNLNNSKAPKADATFTGTITLPGTTTIGDVSSTELSYVNGVTSSIQTQIDTKAPSASPTFTGDVVLPSTTSIGNLSSTEIGYLDGITSGVQSQIDA
ncbi:hypothetical protein EBU71_02335 [bacterium]|nr:hypothetical protein [Candidatus Elulimicrobium humile]